MKIRVFDTLKQRYGTVLMVGIKTNQVLYAIYDEQGDPVELEPDTTTATVHAVNCRLEVETSAGVWEPIAFKDIRVLGEAADQYGEVRAISFFHNEVDFEDQGGTMAADFDECKFEVELGGNWTPTVLEAGIPCLSVL